MAGVGPGVLVFDLGCGDGSALLAAAELGAAVAGIEADQDLAAEAEQHLTDAGVDAHIACGDLLDPTVSFEADVFFAYLAPATLQRLLPRLVPHRGTPLVTVDFDVPGRTPTRRGDAARLYRLPGRRRPVGEAGWSAAGTIVSTVPNVQSLTCLEVVHPAGVIDVSVADPLRGVTTLATGADALPETGFLAIDMRWEPMEEGAVVGGTLSAGDAGSHEVFVIATSHEDEAQWDLTAEGVDNLRRALGGSASPSSAAEMVSAAEG